VASVEPRPWSGIVWRHTFGEAPVLRPNVRGARWNPAGTAALYASLSRATALAEAEHQIALQPVRPRAARTMHQLDVRLTKVADLTDPELLARLGLRPHELGAVDLGACQRIGGALSAAGFEAMLVPSARAAGANLVLFSANLGPAAAVVEASSERLSGVSAERA